MRRLATSKKDTAGLAGRAAKRSTTSPTTSRSRCALGGGYLSPLRFRIGNRQPVNRQSAIGQSAIGNPPPANPHSPTGNRQWLVFVNRPPAGPYDIVLPHLLDI